MSDRQNALKVTQILQNFAKNVGYKMESIRNVRYIRPIDAVRIFFLLTNFSVGLRIFLTELHKKNP